MYTVSFINGTLIVADETREIFKQPFKPAELDQPQRAWNNEDEAFEFWDEVKISFPYITAENTTIIRSTGE